MSLYRDQVDKSNAAFSSFSLNISEAPQWKTIRLSQTFVKKTYDQRFSSWAGGEAVPILQDAAEVQVGHPPVDEVEDVRERPAVQLGFDPLGVRVRSQLLARVLGDQEQGVVLRVGDLELVGAEGADLLGGGIGVHLQGFGRAARAGLLQGDAEEVLQKQTEPD